MAYTCQGIDGEVRALIAALQVHGYGLCLVGLVGLCPAVLALARPIAVASPRLALWGTLGVIFGLFGRAVRLGVEQFAFRLVDSQGLERTIEIVEASYVNLSYGTYRFVVASSVGYILGWLLLGVGAYRSKVTGRVGAFLIAVSSLAVGGILKESDVMSTMAAAALCMVLVPLGVNMLRRQPATQESPATRDHL
jgi:hypothetical protein